MRLLNTMSRMGSHPFENFFGCLFARALLALSERVGFATTFGMARRGLSRPLTKSGSPTLSGRYLISPICGWRWQSAPAPLPSVISP